MNEEFLPLFTSDRRYIICFGGRAGSKSFSASVFALSKLLSDSYFRCAVMRYVLGDIRNSIYRDIIDRANEQEIKDNLTIRENILTVSYGHNTINGIGFRKSSSDQKSKLKSLANYNCVIIEEADEVAEEDFRQLDDSIRTMKSDIKIILLMNPPDKNHWVIRNWFNLVESGIEGYYIPELKDSEKHNTEFIYTTYKNNAKNIDEATKAKYERYKELNPDHYYTMVRGLVSTGKRGIIYPDWQFVTEQEFEELEYPVFYGLDFGFTNDPTALVAIKQHNENVYVRELLYETGLTNQRLSQRFSELGVDPTAPIYADSAEPKSIDELLKEGWLVEPATKGQGSINAGIDYLKSMQVYITENSSNLEIERQEYRWALDKDKNPTNKPIDEYNHGMDALRYGVYTHGNQPFIGFA